MSTKKTARKPPKVAPKRVAASSKHAGETSRDELRTHYDLDYSKSKPNRFADRFARGALVVVIDPDVADVFQSSEAVNTFLRSAISAMPAAEGKKKRAS